MYADPIHYVAVVFAAMRIQLENAGVAQITINSCIAGAIAEMRVPSDECDESFERGMSVAYDLLREGKAKH